MTGSTFTLHRSADPSGVSGTGVVAEGWESSTGEFVCLVWLSTTPTLGVYRDIREVELLHGHEGKTVLVWDTPSQYTPSAPLTDEAPAGWNDLIDNASPLQEDNQ